MSDIKYDFTVTSFRVLETSYAYWGLTRYGPFDKIYFSSYLEPNQSYYKVSQKNVGFSVIHS